MIRNKRYRKSLLLLRLLIIVGDVILDTKLGKSLEEGYRNSNKFIKPNKQATPYKSQERKEIKLSKLKNILDIGMGIVSKRASKKQEEEHKKIAEENKQKFNELWEEKYDKNIKGRVPLDFYDGNTGDKDE